MIYSDLLNTISVLYSGTAPVASLTLSDSYKNYRMIGINAFYGDGSCVRQIIFPAEIDYIVKANRYIILPGHDAYRVSIKFTTETSASLQYEGATTIFVSRIIGIK